MEYDLDYLLDKTENYLNGVDLSGYIPRVKTDVQEIANAIVADLSDGTLPALPLELEGNLFKAFDIWDLTVYLRKRYNLQTEEECVWRYWVEPKIN